MIKGLFFIFQAFDRLGQVYKHLTLNSKESQKLHTEQKGYLVTSLTTDFKDRWHGGDAFYISYHGLRREREREKVWIMRILGFYQGLHSKSNGPNLRYCLSGHRSNRIAP